MPVSDPPKKRPTLRELYEQAHADAPPGCPRCGCPGFAAVAEVFGGKRYVRRECLNCGYRTEPEGKRIELSGAKNVCPNCGSSKYLVGSTQGRTQYRKCNGCGYRGKTSK